MTPTKRLITQRDLVYNRLTHMGDKTKLKKPVMITPYQFSKLHPELGLIPQAVYQHCLKQAAPHAREKGGRVVINEAEFLSWFNERAEAKQLKVSRKQHKSK